MRREQYVQICENVREGSKVRQQVVRHVGIAQNDIHLIELKQLTKAIKAQILEERKGPFLWSKDSGERGAPCGVPQHTTQSDTLAGHGPEGAPPILSSDRSNQRLPVDLCHLREKQRVIEGFHEVFGKIFCELGFHSFLGVKPTEVLQDVLLARIAAPASKNATRAVLANAGFGAAKNSIRSSAR